MPRLDVEKILKNIKEYLRRGAEKIKHNPLCKYLSKIRFSWVYILYGLPAFFILYYPLGAYLVEDIDADTDIEIKKATPEQSDLVSAIVFIIDKETNRHAWTPNTPVIFPAYLLDNMPEFQMGEMKAASVVSSTFAEVMSEHLHENSNELNEAAQYLQYSPKIWFFAENSDKIFAPSSSTQYNKAKRKLLNFNQKLIDRRAVFTYNSGDFEKIMFSIHKDLAESTEDIKNHINENAGKFSDFQADNLFYYTKGKLYAYYILLRAIGQDYKNVIIGSGRYSQWTAMLKWLKEGAEFSPFMVRNAELDSSISPNHLAYMNMYTLWVDSYVQSFIDNQDREI